MVFDTGRVVEYAAPRELLQRKDGYLRALVNESLDKEDLLTMVGIATTSA
jgi:ABC-type multidrug transport system fused ATPase/permease subunit